MTTAYAGDDENCAVVNFPIRKIAKLLQDGRSVTIQGSTVSEVICPAQ